MSGKPRPFHVADDLSAGPVVIEASAGTGKTFALANIAARLLADGEAITSQLLVVTFTRAATAELRSRIRRRLIEVRDVLRSPALPGGDELFAYLTTVGDVAGRLGRIEDALSDFDAMTVSTIHGFAQQMLSSLGSVSLHDPDLSVVADEATRQRDACADVLAIAATGGFSPDDLPSCDDLGEVVRLLGQIPDICVFPETDEPPIGRPQVVAHLARRVEARLRFQRRAIGVRSYSELLTDLRDTLVRSGGTDAATVLGQRYRVALIDEFQDTDAVQWDILSSIFANSSDNSLVLVGDPKQAIYRFRGADIQTYLHVVSTSSDVRALETNWRSSPAMINALNVLFDQASFGDGVDFRSVSPAPITERTALVSRTSEPLPPVRIRLALGDDIERTTRPKAHPYLRTPDVFAAVTSDLADQLLELFDGARFVKGPSENSVGDRVRPGDVAVLVSTHHEEDEVSRRLQEAGIPAVVLSGSNVLESPAAYEWRTFLEAVAVPSDLRRARAAALTVFGDFTDVTDLVQADDERLANFQEQLQSRSQTLGSRGVTDFVHESLLTRSLASRVLARPDGDRLFTDLEHIGEVFQREIGSGSSSPSALLGVLVATEDEAASDDKPTARRIETDADAVQIMTMHVSKGLEFPIVCCPSLYKGRSEETKRAQYFDPVRGQRVLDLDPKTSDDEPLTKAAREAADDRLRLLYVAMTRAKHQVIMWWSRVDAAQKAPLTRLLYGRGPDGTIDSSLYNAPKVVLPDDDEAEQRLAGLVGRSDQGIEVTVHGHPGGRGGRVAETNDAAGEGLQRATLERVPDRRSFRWSFSAMTAHDDDTATPVDRGGVLAPGADEGPTPSETTSTPDSQDQSSAIIAALGDPEVSALSTLPAGTAFGTLVHEVLERIDFTAADVSEQLDEEIERQLARRTTTLTPVGFEGADARRGRMLLRDGILGVLETPLGATFDGLRLRQISTADRLSELSFELHLAGGEPPVTDALIGRLLLDHLDSGDPYRPWAETLASGRFNVDLVGHLTGSIDLVVRVGRPDAPRFVVVDYKTNRLHDWHRVPDGLDYGTVRMSEAMVEHHYPLQALLYSVALHRYLRWRLPGYRPDAHLGGAAYLFVRGMSGPHVLAPQGEPNGVCAWSIPTQLIVELSDVFAGENRQATS